jgi:hypothetical protein
MIKLFESYNNVIDKFKNMIYVRNEHYIFIVEKYNATKKRLYVTKYSNEKFKYDPLEFIKNWKILSDDEKQDVFNDKLVLQVYCTEKGLRCFRPKYFSEIIKKEIKKAELQNKMKGVDPYSEEEWGDEDPI